MSFSVTSSRSAALLLLLCCLYCAPGSRAAFEGQCGRASLSSLQAKDESEPSQAPDECSETYPGTLCTATFGAKYNKCAFVQPVGGTCAGKNPGNCPARGSWPSSAFPDGTICAFTTKETNCSDPNIECATEPVKLDNGSVVMEEGIWACVASDWVCDGSSSYSVLKEPCGNCITNNQTLELCNTHGACYAPVPDKDEYRCVCEPGWAGDFCEKPISNECSVLTGCGRYGTCNPDSNSCDCESGWTGNQCVFCTSNSSCNAANGGGYCDMEDGEGSCVCTETEYEKFYGFDCTNLNITGTRPDDGAAPGNSLLGVVYVLAAMVAAVVAF